MTGATEYSLSLVWCSEHLDGCHAVADEPCCDMLLCKQVYSFDVLCTTFFEQFFSNNLHTHAKLAMVKKTHKVEANAVPCNQLHPGQHASACAPVSGFPQTM